MTEYSKLSSDQTFPDNALKREFLRLSARCPYPGCTWSGSFKEFEVHFLDCEFLPPEPTEVKSLQLGDGSLVESLSNLNTRIDSSERFVVQLTSRVDKAENNIRRLESQAGLSSASVREASLPMVPVSSVGATAHGDTSGAGASSSVVAVTPSELKATQDKMNTFEGIVTILDRELEKYSEQISSMGRQDRLFHDVMSTVERKSLEVERTMVSKDRAIMEVETRVNVMDQTSYDGTLLWKITNFNNVRENAIAGRATSVYSPPFYTSKTGYKMCTRIYPNGDGMGKGTHVSLFFVVMRGQYDALLRWPFRQKVTMMILDQSQHEHVIDSFRPDPTSSSFKRPTAEMNVASGCPLFMSLTALDSASIAYVRDNTLFVKVVVSLDGITT